MWLTTDEEKKLDGIRNTRQLTEQEQDAVKTYDAFKGRKELNNENGKADNGPGPVLIRELQDILEKHGGNKP
jgi:hypothetical protein